jgi:hypothetical protein
MTVEHKSLKKKRAVALIVVTTILTGTFFALQAGPENIPRPPSIPAQVTDTPADLLIFTDTPAYQSCAYTWASHDQPELSTQLELAVRESYPEANARAMAYGEDCEFADGRVQFGAMETDFYVTLPVVDLTDKAALGNMLASVMTTILERFPRQDLPGPVDGFVEFRFEQSDAENLILRVPIQRYKAEGADKTGLVLFELFHSVP